MIDAILTNTVLPAISREFLDADDGRAAALERRAAERRRTATSPTGSSERGGPHGRAARQTPPREVSLDEAIADRAPVPAERPAGRGRRRVLHGCSRSCPSIPTRCTSPACSRTSGAQREAIALIERSLAARARPRRLVQQPRHHLQGEGPASTRRSRPIARHRARPEPRQRAQQPRRAAAGAGQARRSRGGVPQGDSSSTPSTSMRTTTSGVLLAASGGRRRPWSATAG